MQSAITVTRPPRWPLVVVGVRPPSWGSTPAPLCPHSSMPTHLCPPHPSPSFNKTHHETFLGQTNHVAAGPAIEPKDSGTFERYMDKMYRGSPQHPNSYQTAVTYSFYWQGIIVKHCYWVGRGCAILTVQLIQWATSNVSIWLFCGRLVETGREQADFGGQPISTMILQVPATTLKWTMKWNQDEKRKVSK